MYLVTVTNVYDGKVVERMAFPFGKWPEIGLWLDNLGLNDKRFKATIDFWEGNE